MKKSTLLVILIATLLFGANRPAQAQQTNDKGAAYQFLLGEWVGDGTGKPGEGEGSFTFQKELAGNILIRHNHTNFPAANGKPAVIHNDLLIVYLDDAGALTKAIYFDNEGHVINYAITANPTEKSLVFTSEVQANKPTFRLTYKSVDKDHVIIDFEIAQPGKPDSFFKYLSGKAHRKGTN